MDPNARRVHPQQALAVYAEPLVVGQRVAIFGDASLDLGMRVAELGARVVQVWDPDVERARREAERAPAGVVVRALTRDELDARGGAFDLAIVADLELFEDAAHLLARVRRLVGDKGVALVCAPNRDRAEDSDTPARFDYYELFDLVAGEFQEVRMIAQLPFHGIALAELGEDEEDESPAVSVDTQLAVREHTPEAFVVLASQRGVRLDPYAIIELPEQPPAGESEALRERFAEAELGALAIRRLEEALDERSLQVAELETALASRVGELTHLSQEVERMRVVMATEQIATARFEELAFRADRAERALAALQPEAAHAAEAQTAELVRYEEALRDRAHAIRLLETELVRREQMIRELVDSLEETARGGAVAPVPEAPSEHDALLEENVRLRQKLDELALELARREGEAQATVWSIKELEHRLEEAAAAVPRPDVAASASPKTGADAGASHRDVERQLAATLDELDVLRRALAQEHEARIRAESRFAPAAGGELPPEVHQP
jgi:regulator of replication initiation timing